MSEPSCSNCKHWRGGTTCDAFPNGIPWPIQSGDVSHLKPLSGDNDIQYEPSPDVADGKVQDATNAH